MDIDPGYLLDLYTDWQLETYQTSVWEYMGITFDEYNYFDKWRQKSMSLYTFTISDIAKRHGGIINIPPGVWNISTS